MLNSIICKRSRHNRWRICSCCDFKELQHFGIQHKNVWSTLSPAPHLEHGLTAPNEKQHYLIVSKADYLWLQNPHFRQCNTLPRCIRATTPLRAIEDSERGGALISFRDANPLEESGIRLFCFREWSAAKQTASIRLHPCVRRALSVGEAHACLCARVRMCLSESCQRFHTATGCRLVVHARRVGEAYCRESVNVCLCVGVGFCVPSCLAHGMPNGTSDTLSPCVSCQASAELTSYFELFHPHLKSLSSHLPCSHSPCPPTWNWGFTALITKSCSFL